MAKILLVEDDESVANMYKTELEVNGHEVVLKTDGSDVLSKVVEISPELILLDIQLPEKDGLTILEELKENSDTKDFKVVVLTNFATEDNIDKAIDTGAEDFIPKHKIVPEELSAKVAEYVN